MVCECSMPSTKLSKSIIGLGLNEALDRLFPHSDDPTKNRLIDEYRRCFLSKTISEYDFFAGVSDLLKRLHANGYLLAIATGKSRAGLDAALQNTGVESLFSATSCADETASKPDPAMLNLLMDELSITADVTLMVGDSEHDLKMAANADVASVGVACGANDYDKLIKYQPIACLDHTADLASLLL